MADANEHRDWRIYADFAQVLIGMARKLYANDGFAVELDAAAYAFDSTTIDLCLSLFPWARFRRRKGAVKLHTLIDLRGNIPCFIHISHGKMHDVNALDDLVLEPGAFYIMDRGYIDFARLYAFTPADGVLHHPWQTEPGLGRQAYRSVDKSTGLRSDQKIILKGPKTAKDYPVALRRITYVDAETSRRFTFLTNNMTLPALTIAQALQVPLAGRVVLQVDQATSADQGFLRDFPERGEDPGVDCHQRLRARGHREEGTQARTEPLRNPANSERGPFRENAYFSGSCEPKLSKTKTPRARNQLALFDL